MTTPWGESQGVETVADGIQWISTASHGGAHLAADRNAVVPAYFKQSTFNQQGEQGWYEEDTDWAIPALVFQADWRNWILRQTDLANAEQLFKDAAHALMRWHGPAFDRWCREQRRDRAAAFTGLGNASSTASVCPRVGG